MGERCCKNFAAGRTKVGISKTDYLKVVGFVVSRASAVMVGVVVESSTTDSRIGTSDVGWPPHRLERPYQCQSQRLEKMNLWKMKSMMASGSDRRMTETSRDDEQAKHQLACYQSQGRCWSPVELTEGSIRQNRIAWQRQRR